MRVEREGEEETREEMIEEMIEERRKRGEEKRMGVKGTVETSGE